MVTSAASKDLVESDDKVFVWSGEASSTKGQVVQSTGNG